MTKSLSTITYQPTTDPQQWIAAVNVDTSVDPDWIISLQSAVSNASDNIVAGYAMCDNMKNNGTVEIDCGPYALTIPQYTRKTVQLPAGTQSLQVKASVGVVPIYLTTKYPGVPDDTNQYAINQELAPKAVWTPKVITANQTQTNNDLNTYVEFVSATPLTYSLASLNGGTIVSGFYQKLLNAGSAAVTLLPSPGDEANGIYTNAKPIVLNPGDYVDLFYDGSQWQIHGELHFESQQIALVSPMTGLIAHSMGQRPQKAWGLIRCLTAEYGYSVGEEIEMHMFQDQGGYLRRPDVSALNDGTNLRYVLKDLPTILRADTQAYVTVTAANWALVARASLRL